MAGGRDLTMSTDPRLGSRLGSYRIDAVLGRGGMGVVYLAEHLRLKKKVALKVLPPELAADQAFRLRFERESQIAAALDHPNIVTVHDAGEADGLLYIAMRYVEGTDLAGLLRTQGALEPGWALAILGQAADALDEAHAAGLVHRDVKPANILLAPARRGTGEHVFLSDFGLAKEWASASHLTRSGYFVGTIHYSSPEQFQSGPIDGRTDVYSLGCVLFECLTGRVPYDRASDPAVMYAHLQEPPPSATSLRTELPPAIDDVVATAMAKRKEDRYPTCGEMVGAARRVMVEGDVAPPPTARPPLATVEAVPPTVARELTPAGTPTEPESRVPGKGRRAWWVALIVILVAGLAGGGFLFLRSGGFGQTDGEGGGEQVYLRPDLVTASDTALDGMDDCGNPVPFDPDRVIDGQPTSAWRVAGPGVGEVLTLAYQGQVHVRRVGLLPGYAKVDPCSSVDRFVENRVIRRVEYRFDDGTTVVQVFDPDPEVQYVDVDEVTGTVVITVLATSPHGGRDYTAISEVEVYGDRET
jgi:hypothetical protein